MRLIRKFNVHIVGVAVVALVALMFAAVSPGGSPPAADATHQGVVQPNPVSGPILQGHKTSIPVQMVTCPTVTATFNNPCRVGAYEVKMTYDPARFSLVSDQGISSGGNTTTTLNDTSKNWLPNQWAGEKIVLRSGAGIVGGDGALQYRNILSNTATQLTISPPWDGAVVPDATTKYALGGAGISTGGNTSTTFKDINRGSVGGPPAWKTNQWAGSRITLLGGTGYTGADGNPQSRIVVSNTSNTLTVSPAWDGGVIPLPNNTTRYMLGGMTDGGFLGSTGRPTLCPNDPVISGGMANLACISLGNGPPWGANGTGNLTNLTVQAGSTTVGSTPCGSPGAWVACYPRGVTSITLVTPDTQTLRIDGFDILADVVSGTRRIMLCPDVNPTPDNLVSAIDLSLISQQFLKTVGQTGYSTTRDPDENGVITAIDLSLTAQVFGKRCTQT